MDCEEDPGWNFLRQTREQIIQDQSKPYDSKKNCWVPDAEDGYIGGEIAKVEADLVTLVTSRGNQITLKHELVQEMNPPKFEKTEDMSNLTFLNDASVLHNLRARYARMLIYTYSGLFCVVINPYKRLPIYTESIANMYMGKRRNEMPPHLFSVSDQAYRNMLIDHENQSMLITGESGAGKTENTKKVIAYFAAVGAKQNEAEGIKGGKKKATLEDQIVQMNPVLEAFGNAKTVRNNNSSRFGKFIRIHFSKLGRVASCDIEHYLLEKSRVIRQAPGERCYHIFYQIFSGISKIKQKLLLDRPLKDYYFVSQAELEIDGVNDREEFQATDEAFDVLNFTVDQKMNCYRLVSAHMHMGNMKFKQRPREEQAEIDGKEEAEKAAEMFGVEVDKFLLALLKPKVKVGTEMVTKGQNLEQVTWSVGAIAKGLYNKLFDWIVSMCNETLQQTSDQQRISRDHFIGVLDIAGFEIFDFNSFEQLWINFVNEKLQQFFNHHMFVLEQEEYEREGIQWKFIDFGLDLQACIELIEKPMGILSMLDEECIVPKATDNTLAQKLNDQHLGKHPNFEKPKSPKGKQAEAHFAMRHYAGTVRYNCSNWLEKNKDPLNETMISVLKASTKNQLLVEIWATYQTQDEISTALKEFGGKKKGKSGSFMTVSMLYRDSLNNLMCMLHKTHPHFIRCIIPNEKKQSGVLDAALVLNQLTCNGVLEGIRICRKGFPNRTLHADFKQRYGVLAGEKVKSDSENDSKKCAEAMLEKMISLGYLNSENFRIGKTKVFFKAGVLGQLEEVRDEKMKCIFSSLQAAIRSYLGQIDVKRRVAQKAGLLIVQRNVKSWCGFRTWEWLKLLNRVRPLLTQTRIAEEIEKLSAKLTQLSAALNKEQKLKSELQFLNEKLIREKTEVLNSFESTKASIDEAEEKVAKLEKLKAKVDSEIEDFSEKLEFVEEENEGMLKEKRRFETEVDEVRKRIQRMEITMKKAESERLTKDHQIRSLHDEIQQQDVTIGKLMKERKNLEETNFKLQDELKILSDKNSQQTKNKSKLEQTMDDLEEAMEIEKRARVDSEKQKRKLEGEMKIANETLEEQTRFHADLLTSLKRKDQELNSMISRFEEEENSLAQLQKQCKEVVTRGNELAEELEVERQTRNRIDRAKSDLQIELEDLGERLEEQGSATIAHSELNKKREAELIRLRREIDEAAQQHETQLATMRKKTADTVTELSEQLEQVSKSIARIDRDRFQSLKDQEDLQVQLETEISQKSANEKLCRFYDSQLEELHEKFEEQEKEILEQTTTKNRLQNNSNDLHRRLENIESEIGQINRVKAQLQTQLITAKQLAEDESGQRASEMSEMKTSKIQIDQLREQLEDEIEARAEIGRQVAKGNTEIQEWKMRFEGQGLLRREEIEEAKRKQQHKIHELTDGIETINCKILMLEKQKSRLAGELDDAQIEVDRAASLATSLEQRQKGHDKIVEDLKQRVDELRNETETAQREARNSTSELFRARTAQDELQEIIDSLKRENKSSQDEIRDLSNQLNDGGKQTHEIQKLIRRLESEKDEVQQELESAERALEAAEGKVTSAQTEITYIRSEIEKRIKEKDEEFENTRRNHQRAMESIQASIETEAKAKADLLKLKKNVEGEINGLEIQLDQANKINADTGKALKKCLDQMRDVQLQLEEEHRIKDEIRDQLFSTQKRVAVLRAENEDLHASNQMVIKERNDAQTDATEAREESNSLATEAQSLNALKRRLEGELQALQVDLDETLNNFKLAEEKSRKGMAEATRLAEELTAEQEKSREYDGARQRLSEQLKDFQTRLDEAEGDALKAGKKAIARMEQRVQDMEADVEVEQRRNQDLVQKQARAERRVRELQFQIEEDKKNYERLNALVDQLQTKLRTQKRQLEEAEELANTNMQKFRQIQMQLDEAEDRAESAEQALIKLRSKTRAGTSAPRQPALQTSATVAAMGRHRNHDH